MQFKNILKPNYTDQNWRKPLAYSSNPVDRENVPLQNIERSQLPVEADGEPKDGQAKEFVILKKRQAATNMELFFDLFFVANLSSFASAHEINTNDSLRSYIGYITILWFYWLQTAFYDIRFYRDSISSRISKAMHLGIMTGLAVLAPNFDTNEPLNHPRRFRNTTLIIMGSRILLAVQYGFVAWYVRGYKKTLAAKLTTVGVLFTSAMIYLILAFAATKEHGRYAYLAWYIIPFFEALFMVVISSRWESLSFKDTPIVERFGGMTLMVLGEGIVGMTKTVSSITKGTQYPTAVSVVLITGYLIINYFIFMIYFDQVDEKRFGFIRQQIWALLHYPFHIAILITNEGSRAFVLFAVATDFLAEALDTAKGAMRASTTGGELAASLRAMAATLAARLRGNKPPPDFEPTLRNITALSQSSSASEGEAEFLVDKFISQLVIWLTSTFGIEIEPGKSATTNTEVQIDRISDKFLVTFRFYFICSGLVLVSLGLLHWFSKSHKSRGESISIIITTVMGVILSLISLLVLTDDPNDLRNPFNTYSTSGFIVPTVVIAFGLVVAIDNLIILISHKRRTKYAAQAYRQV
ncbi:hypothetical protein LOZ04_002591 [Ophidiomyces ophidiicola]|uniref:Uncharacterized protein n=1 Tax=Ophidiomyces ophidiicola TaxID=1387563 RepID=A0ACB8UU61_9EURO|nr:hypothetical protein LOZ64_002998 [Ophidiomyces ophidiicola]KAI1955205.1 hypothetical protein LOZ62_000329 [Ophidiomyces ophidiicola]KAI1967356.1 hypothetical protein LOZ59_000724 [Ophidiomyces ophidiicola]KAI1970612.1 hypothetical protein LOZ56_003575 [Ophidiomyces ophidiicola]KAI2012267.1 hypothetical protein LOZ50_000186 [Ophidiomyces ophidiicola]